MRQDLIPPEVTPEAGEGALGSWRTWVTGPRHRTGRTVKEYITERSNPTGKLNEKGAKMNQRLNLVLCRQAVEGKASVRTGLGKPDSPGSQGGLRKRGMMGVGLRPTGKPMDTPPNP